METAINWDAISAVSEVLGLTAVFATLVYLAVQVRQNTHAVRATALDASIRSISEIRRVVLEDPELTEIYRQGLGNPDSLSEADLTRFRLLMHNIFWSIWNVYVQSHYAGLSTSVWRSQLPLIARHIDTAGGRWFWENYRHEFEMSFQNEVDGVATADSG